MKEFPHRPACSRASRATGSTIGRLLPKLASGAGGKGRRCCASSEGEHRWIRQNEPKWRPEWVAPVLQKRSQCRGGRSPDKNNIQMSKTRETIVPERLWLKTACGE